MKRAILCLILLTSVASVMAEDFQLVPGSLLGKLGVYDEIPSDHNESVVIAKSGFPPEEVSFLFAVPFDRLSTVLARHLNSAAIGAPSAVDERVNFERNIPPAFTSAARSMADDNLKRIRDSGFDIQDVRMVRFVFPPFNRNDLGDEYSKLEIQVADAKGIFGVEGSIVVVARTDETFSKLRTFHLGVPLPAKKRTQVRLVTSTELKLLADFQEASAWAAVGTVPTWSAGQPFRAFKNLDDMRALLTSPTLAHRPGSVK